MLKGTVAGRVTQDVELRKGKFGTFTSINVASNKREHGKDGKIFEKTQYVRVIAQGKYAETCAKNLHKGYFVSVTGDLEAKAYTKRDNSLGCDVIIRNPSIEWARPMQVKNMMGEEIEDANNPFAPPNALSYGQ